MAGPTDTPEAPDPAAPPTRRRAFLLRTAEALAVEVSRLRRLALAIEQGHYRRFVISFIAGLLVLGLMRVPMINRSMFGEPDRQMMETAFKMRADLLHGGDPGLFIDIDDQTIASLLPTGPARRAPMATAPRGIIADALEYVREAPQGKGAAAVVLDTDLATPTPGDEAGAAKLHKVLAAWAQTPSAPELMIVRQSFPEATFDSNGDKLILPTTNYDDVVTPAPNIMWASGEMLADQNGVMREFRPYICVVGPTGPTVLYSATLLSYGFLQNGHIPHDAAVRPLITGAEKDCANPRRHANLHGELVNYHLSLGKGENERVWPDLSPDWKGFARCGSGADRAVFRRVSASDVAAAGPDASHELVCGRLVIIGGTNIAANDFEQTPLNEMSGSVIIINAVRGLELSGGGLRRVPLWLQLLVLLVVSAGITAGFALTRRVREHYAHLKSRHRGHPWHVRLRLMPFNPVVLNFVFAFAAHWVGIGLLLISLDRGYWGYLSASAFASAAVGAMQEVADDE